ncbi:MAG: ATP-binding cassette domain-containing protein, partial [Acetatifactor muris]|nr:ATP-binding cassette domain-containing protein [Acetatifactor muris]
ALEFNRKSNLDMEKLMTPYTMLQELVLQIAGIAMMFISVYCWADGTMSLADALMCIVMSFLVFGQIKLFGMGIAMLRLTSASIDRTLQTQGMEQMDEKGSVIRPESHGISAEIPDKTTTAVVGPSGSGKTTLCSLIARFWDVDSGSVAIGGHDVREYTLESLMEQISMVFQDVYLFADTVENNIRFGRPGATREEVAEAARRACCDDFIEALPDGYNTVIGEGGASLSGGEKQRISIARAMLKDAPIVILDEATANVDPENEDRLQKAIEELTRNKTIIMIAHRLKTVRNADQILVVDDGRIVQRGRHEELIGQEGIYADFVVGRREAIGWKLKDGYGNL